jgi:hypothetical protein
MVDLQSPQMQQKQAFLSLCFVYAVLHMPGSVVGSPLPVP